jgi:hypothetical protein
MAIANIEVLDCLKWPGAGSQRGHGRIPSHSPSDDDDDDDSPRHQKHTPKRIPIAVVAVTQSSLTYMKTPSLTGTYGTLAKTLAPCTSKHFFTT